MKLVKKLLVICFSSTQIGLERHLPVNIPLLSLCFTPPKNEGILIHTFKKMVRGEKAAPEPKMSEEIIIMRQPIPIIADKTRENGPNEVTSNEISSQNELYG